MIVDLSSQFRLTIHLMGGGEGAGKGRRGVAWVFDIQKIYKYKNFEILGKSLDACQPARAAQADMGGNFFQNKLDPFFAEHGSHKEKIDCMLNPTGTYVLQKSNYINS